MTSELVHLLPLEASSSGGTLAIVDAFLPWRLPLALPISQSLSLSPCDFMGTAGWAMSSLLAVLPASAACSMIYCRWSSVHGQTCSFELFMIRKPGTCLQDHGGTWEDQHDDSLGISSNAIISRGGSIMSGSMATQHNAP